MGSAQTTVWAGVTGSSGSGSIPLTFTAITPIGYAECRAVSVLTRHRYGRGTSLARIGLVARFTQRS